MSAQWSARRLSALLTIIGIMLWSYSTSQAKLRIGFFGLIDSFPVSFFVGLGFLTFASAILWVSPGNHEKLLFLQWSLLVVALWVNPILLGAQGWGSEPCPNGQFGNIEYIIRQGYLRPDMMTYHNWPAAWIFIAELMEIGGIDDPSFMTMVTPVALQFLFFVPMYALFRNIFGVARRNYFWAGLWMFELGNWVPQSYLSAQAFAYFLFLTALCLLAKTSPWQQRSAAPGSVFALILVLVCLPVYHFFTSLIVLCTMTALVAANRGKSSPVPLILGAVFDAGWTIYGSIAHLREGLAGFLDQAFRLDKTLDYMSAGYGAGSAEYHAVVWIRILHGTIFLAIAFAGSILGRKTDRSSNITALAMFAGPIVLGAFMGAGYGVELVHRIFFFALPSMCYFGVKLLNRKTAALTLCILFLALLPLHFICHYGEVSPLSRAEITSIYFFHDHTSRGNIIGADNFGRIRNPERYGPMVGEWFNDESFGYPKGDIVGFLNHLRGDVPHYVAVSGVLKRSIEYHYNDSRFMERVETYLDNATSCNLVYASLDVKLYIHEGGK